MYIETSRAATTGTKARLLSPRISVDDPRIVQNCNLQFWYHMNGVAVGTLNVYVKSANLEGGQAVLWSLSRNQPNRWQLVNVSFFLEGFNDLQVLRYVYLFILTLVYEKKW